MLRIRSLWLAAPLAVLGLALPARADDKPARKPVVEVVFCLDTTGSMGGLIEGAKQKIWSICNQIANGKPTPDLKVGLVAFRDRGDAYITKVFDLSDDLDAIHGHLKGFKAEGGGDIPESVNQALDDAVNKIKWSTDNKTLRIIFLVGDAPPHMDYPDDVKYPVSCEKAARKGIIINTIQCGGDPQCTRFWKDICAKAEGNFVQIAQDGGVAVVATPFDKRLGEINGEMARSTLAYGHAEQRKLDRAKSEAAAGLAPEAAAARVAFQAKNAQAATYDLLDNIKQKKVQLKDLKEEELPEELKKLKPAEREAYLKKLEEKRQALRKEALELDKKRSDYIVAEQKKQAQKGQAGFDNQVLDILRKQAAKSKIEY
jgi:Mg-chelatase subunit ChlD